MSEQEPKKYYYTWSKAEKERLVHEGNGRGVCSKAMMHNDVDPREWKIGYNRITERNG